MSEAQSEVQIQGPAWDNSLEYKGFDAPEYKADQKTFDELLAQIRKTLTELQPRLDAMLASGKADAASIKQLQEVSKWRWTAVVLGGNVGSFSGLEAAIDSKNETALKESAKMEEKFAELDAAYLPLELFLSRVSKEIFEAYLTAENTKAEKFYLEQLRRNEEWTLSAAEEVLLTQFRQHGPSAWGRLYDQISGTAEVKCPTLGKMGLAKASAFLRSPKESEREEAWKGIQSSWKTYEDSVASILNSLAGWRLEEYKKRSVRKPMNFLSQPLSEARIERATLDAMMKAIEMRSDLVQRGLKLMAKRLGKSKLAPWDLMAPAPMDSQAAADIPYDTGIGMVRKTFASLDSEMGTFIDTMVTNKWIDGRVLPNKRTGAFCSGFYKSRSPRVFQTYMGSLQDVSTLAHELGHAFHSWSMRDMPLVSTNYPMTLAETASIFAETAMADELASHGDDSMKLAIAWADVSDIVALLGNIPARFEFEKNFYVEREKGVLSPKELNALMAAAWRKYYGEALTEVEEQFWMTKLHFSIPSISFYNYPYSFGYLFSLAVYSRRKTWGPDFFKNYVALLRDTGRMTAEELIQKHFGEDIRQPEFWLKSLEICEEKVARFEALD